MESVNRPLVVLSFRVVVAAFLGMVLLGAVGGALGAAVVVRRLVRVSSDGSRVVERVERIETTKAEALAKAAEALAPSVIPLLDDRRRVLQQAVALTDDGVIASVGPVPRGALAAQDPGGTFVPASVVRVYPEVGLWFARVRARSAVPMLAREGSPLPGLPLAAVSGATAATGHRVRILSVESVRVGGTRAHGTYAGLAELPVLADSAPPSFQGAPVVDADGDVQGLLLISRDGASMLPARLLDTLLQDVLAHPEDTEVSALGGLQGQWRREASSPQEALTFRVTDVPPGSPGLRTLVPGDEILTADGAALTGPVPLVSAFLSAARATKVLSLSVRRGTATLALEIHPAI